MRIKFIGIKEYCICGDSMFGLYCVLLTCCSARTVLFRVPADLRMRMVIKLSC